MTFTQTPTPNCNVSVKIHIFIYFLTLPLLIKSKTFAQDAFDAKLIQLSSFMPKSK